MYDGDDIYLLDSKQSFTIFRSDHQRIAEGTICPSAPLSPPPHPTPHRYARPAYLIVFLYKVRKRSGLWGLPCSEETHIQGPTLLHNTHLSAKNNQNTHRRYCLIIDIVLIWAPLWGQKAQFNLDLWSFNVTNLDRPSEIMKSQWRSSTRLLNDLFKASFTGHSDVIGILSTQEDTFLLLFFPAAHLQGCTVTLGRCFSKGGAGSVIITENGPSYLRRHWGICLPVTK